MHFAMEILEEGCLAVVGPYPVLKSIVHFYSCELMDFGNGKKGTS